MTSKNVFAHKEEKCFPEMISMAYLPNVIIALGEHGSMNYEKLCTVVDLDPEILLIVLNNDLKSEFIEFCEANNEYFLTDFGLGVSKDLLREKQAELIAQN